MSLRSIRPSLAVGAIIAPLLLTACAAGGGDSAGGAGGAGSAASTGNMGTSTSTGSTGDGSVSLTIGAVASPTKIQGISPMSGRYFLTIEVTLKDIATAAPVPAGFAFYSLTTTKSLSLLPSSTSGAVDTPCSTDTSVNPGGQFTCTLAFEVPTGDEAASLSYNDLKGHAATAPVSFKSTLSASCMTLNGWQNKDASACYDCILSNCQNESIAFQDVLFDGTTCPSSQQDCAGCMLVPVVDDFCDCYEGCASTCKPALMTLEQCMVTHCGADCM